MKLAIVIPTTDGPVWIKRISRLKHAPLSQVITEHDFVPDAEIASRYHALVDHSGPLRGLINATDLRFELCLDRLPEMGRSWELAVSIAHWAIDNGHDLESDDPDILVWATGVVRPDKTIADENYQIEQKVKQSGSKIAELAKQSRLIAVLPDVVSEKDQQEVKLGLGAQTVTNVSDVDAAIRVVQQAIHESPAELANPSIGLQPTAPQLSSNKHAVAAVVGALVLAASGLWYTTQYWEPKIALKQNVAESTAAIVDGSSVEPITPSSIPAASENNAPTELATSDSENEPQSEQIIGLLLVEHRAPKGSTCRDVLFGSAAHVVTKLTADARQFKGSEISGLCALSFELSDATTEVEIELPDTFLKNILSSDREMAVRLGSATPRLFRLTENANRLEYDLVAVSSKGERTTFRHGLLAK